MRRGQGDDTPTDRPEGRKPFPGAQAGACGTLEQSCLHEAIVPAAGDRGGGVQGLRPCPRLGATPMGSLQRPGVQPLAPMRFTLLKVPLRGSEGHPGDHGSRKSCEETSPKKTGSEQHSHSPPWLKRRFPWVGSASASGPVCRPGFSLQRRLRTTEEGFPAPLPDPNSPVPSPWASCVSRVPLPPGDSVHSPGRSPPAPHQCGRLQGFAGRAEPWLSSLAWAAHPFRRMIPPDPLFRVKMVEEQRGLT